MTAQLFDKAGGSGASLFAVLHIRKEESANVCVLEAFYAVLSIADNLHDMDKIGRPDIKTRYSASAYRLADADFFNLTDDGFCRYDIRQSIRIWKSPRNDRDWKWIFP